MLGKEIDLKIRWRKDQIVLPNLIRVVGFENRQMQGAAEERNEAKINSLPFTITIRPHKENSRSYLLSNEANPFLVQPAIFNLFIK